MPANMARKELDSIRVDQVGSLVGPHHLREMVERNERGEASADDMRQAQDAAIRDLILKQEAIGLPVLTDGDTQQNFDDRPDRRQQGWDKPLLWRHQ